MRDLLYGFAGLLIGVLLGYILFHNKTPEILVADLELKISKLEKKVSEGESLFEMVNIELSEIHSAIDVITEDTIKNLDLDDYNAVSFLFQLDSIRMKNKERIESLEFEVKKYNRSGGTNLVNNLVIELKKEMQQKEEMLSYYINNLDSLQNVNASLTQIIDITTKEVDSLETELDVSNEQVEILNDKNKKIKKLITRKESLLDSLKSSIAKEKSVLYFNMAEEIMEEYSSMKNKVFKIGQKDTRRSLLLTAYEYYRKACHLGHELASERIAMLLTAKEFEKDLKIERENPVIDNCGV